VVSEDNVAVLDADGGLLIGGTKHCVSGGAGGKACRMMEGGRCIVDVGCVSDIEIGEGGSWEGRGIVTYRCQQTVSRDAM
jgi:hypothetical protein